MLITLECVILALQAVAAVKIPLESPIGTTSPSNNRLSKRSPVELGGDVGQCYTMKSNVHGTDLHLRLDSGVSDVIVPLPSSSSNVGSTPESISSGKPVTINYKSSDYNGITSTVSVTIPGTRITGINLPVLSVKKQSADSVGIHPKFDGVFGLGYTSLSKHHTSVPAIDALYNGGVIPNNEVSIQLCPYGMLSDSFINIGNTDVTAKCGTDGRSVAWVRSPSDDHFFINIKSILVDDEEVELPEEFQKKERKNGHTLYSIIETCFTYMRFPETVVDTLADAILDSDAITVKKTKSEHKRKLSETEIDEIFLENSLMPKSTYNIDWERLPTLTITMHAETPVTDDNRNSVVAIKLGPRDYIQRYDSKNFMFTVQAGSDDNAILGIPFMTQLGLTFDRTHKRVGFGPGCGCETATDGYPTISNSYQVLWPSSQLPKQPSTSGSSGTFIRRRKPTTTTDQVVVPEKTHHAVKSHTTTHDKLD
ncbi:hypothetical protein QVD99_002919 [Batrachochytrium dendrobatidis]|nr:hypothetical protein QVD99_002919 [Batrachochytrium dendrobatidis]